MDLGQSVNLLEKLSNPILAILLFLLFFIVAILIKVVMNRDKKIDALQASKDSEVKELNKVLLEVRESDIEMLVELKNIISRHIEMEKENNEKLKDNNNLLTQLLAKIDYSLRKD